MIITICISVFLSLLLFHILLQYNTARRLIVKIPGPTALPIIGNVLMFNVSSEKVWSTIHRIVDEYYPIVRVYTFMLNLIFIRHPDDMKILVSCKKNIEKSKTVYGDIKNLDNEGLIISGGEKWHQRRKMLNPAFNPDLLKIYSEIANEHAERFVKNMKNKNIAVISDLVEAMNKLAMEVVCEAAMGVDPDTLKSEESEFFRHAFGKVTEMVYYRASRPYIQDWMIKFLPVGRKLDGIIKKCRELTEKIIQDRREYHKRIGYRQFQSIAGDEICTNQRRRLAVLDLLLAAEMDNLIDDRGVNEEVETIILAGYETTGVALTFALMLLAENKAAQDLARDEVTETLKLTDGVLTIADLNNLEYLDRCIKEALRLYPSAPIIGRSITDTIRLGNYKIPHETEVGLNFFALHRDPNFWPDPEKFDPDRFLPDNTQERHPFAYLPFSGGPRTCIGYKFATNEMKTVVARILYNFYLEPLESAAEVKFEMHLTLKPIRPCKVKLIKINRK